MCVLLILFIYLAYVSYTAGLPNYLPLPLSVDVSK